jgi:hypothetical protein
MSSVGLPNISSIIPSMIFGIVLIVGWLPVIILTEKNNKGNSDEYKLLLEKLKTTKFTDVTNQVIFPPLNNAIKFNLPIYLQDLTFIEDSKLNNNVFITVIKKTVSTDDKGRKTTKSDDLIQIFQNNMLIDGNVIDVDNYKYLAMQNNIFSETIPDKDNKDISYDVKAYNIPDKKTYIKVEGLKQFENELQMIIYDYEFGPEEDAIITIKNRKLAIDKLQKWLGRIGTFLMLFIGLALLVSPLNAIVQLGYALPGPLKLLALPAQIILSIYNTLSFFGSLLLTIIMTFLVWTIINKPMLSILVGALLVGLMLYFHKLKN